MREGHVYPDDDLSVGIHRCIVERPMRAAADRIRMLLGIVLRFGGGHHGV